MFFFIPTVVNECNALSVDTRQLKVTPFVFLKKQLAANIAYDNCDKTAHQSKPQFTQSAIHIKTLFILNFVIIVLSIVIHFDAT